VFPRTWDHSNLYLVDYLTSVRRRSLAAAGTSWRLTKAWVRITCVCCIVRNVFHRSSRGLSMKRWAPRERKRERMSVWEREREQERTREHENVHDNHHTVNHTFQSEIQYVCVCASMVYPSQQQIACTYNQLWWFALDCVIWIWTILTCQISWWVPKRTEDKHMNHIIYRVQTGAYKFE